ncbi:MAG: Ty1/Copia family ribonuclease HI, partial [Planctomycetes bacterium]|nr:Ty1/Copia family ribonuclease HI [Planctomycetota bacterium]
MSQLQLTEGPGMLAVFVDANWQGCKETGRSTSGICVTLGGAILSTSSRTQEGKNAMSSGESELRALTKGSLETIYVQNLCEQIGWDIDTPVIWTDSSAGLQASQRLGPGRMKHIDKYDVFIQQTVDSGVLNTKKIKGGDNRADVLTKVMSGDRTQRFYNELELINLDETPAIQDVALQASKAWKPPKAVSWISST